MLEAAIQLLEQGDVASLTTNAVAARAGVSIGTIYQYFDDKQALLDALMERELGAMSAQILDAAQGDASGEPGERIRRLVRAVLGAYGGRSRVHRRLIEHALSRPSGGRLAPLYAQLAEAMTSTGVSEPGKPPQRISRAQAFVLTHAVGGVLRTLAASESTPPLREVEDALVQLATSYIASLRAAHATPHSGKGS